MIIRCAWHGGIIGEKLPYGWLNGKNYSIMITDGICNECAEKYFSITEKRRTECPTEKAEEKAKLES